MDTTHQIEVSALVSHEIAEMQRWTSELAALVARRLTHILKSVEVKGDHRKQLDHALELFTEGAEFLGAVETMTDAALPACVGC